MKTEQYKISLIVYWTISNSKSKSSLYKLKLSMAYKIYHIFNAYHLKQALIHDPEILLIQ